MGVRRRRRCASDELKPPIGSTSAIKRGASVSLKLKLACRTATLNLIHAHNFRFLHRTSIETRRFGQVELFVRRILSKIDAFSIPKYSYIQSILQNHFFRPRLLLRSSPELANIFY